MEVKNKVCTECNRSKTLSEFQKTSKGHLRRRCRECRNDEFKRKRLEVLRTTDMSERRVCNTCNEDKVTQYFVLSCSGPKNICKSCYNKKALDKRNNNTAQKSIAKENSSRFYENNKELVIRRTTEYRKVNPRVNKIAQEKWRKNNLDKDAAKSSRRRAAKKKAVPKWFSSEWEQFFEQEIYSLASLRSEILGISFHVDHAVPIQSDIVCGLHCSSNLQILAGKENEAKGNRWWPDMPINEKQETKYNIAS